MLYAIMILSVLMVLIVVIFQKKFERLQKKYFKMQNEFEEFSEKLEKTNERIFRLNYCVEKKKMAYYAESFGFFQDDEEPLFFEESENGECRAIYSTEDCYPPLEEWEREEKPWLGHKYMVRAPLHDEMAEGLEAKLENMKKTEGED